MYAEGRGVAKDEAKAVQWWAAAAAQGDADAQFNLGTPYPLQRLSTCLMDARPILLAYQRICTPEVEA